MSDLVKFESKNTLPAEIQERLAEESKANLEGVEPRLPKIQMPTGKGKEFSIEQQGADEKQAKELIGIILYQSKANAYWKEKFGAGTTVVPDCASHDGIKPSPQYESLQSDSCVSCPHNRFGTARDDAGAKLPGKACRNVKRVVIQLVDSPEIPFMLTVPPSSNRSFDDFMVHLRKEKRPYYTVGTKITVKTETNRNGIDFPHLQFDIAGYINNKETINMMLDQRKQWTELIKQTLFTGADVSADATPAADPDVDHNTEDF